MNLFFTEQSAVSLLQMHSLYISYSDMRVVKRVQLLWIWVLVADCCQGRSHVRLYGVKILLVLRQMFTEVDVLCACRWRDLQRMKRNNAERLMLSSQD